MVDFIAEALEEPGFWILGGLGIAMELIGFIVSRKAFEASFPIWQLIILMIGTLIAAAYFSTR